MYNKSYYENIDADKHLYYTVIAGKISIIYLTDLDADKYRNKYGGLYSTREDASASLMGGYKFGMSPLACS